MCTINKIKHVQPGKTMKIPSSTSGHCSLFNTNGTSRRCLEVSGSTAHSASVCRGWGREREREAEGEGKSGLVGKAQERFCLVFIKH